MILLSVDATAEDGSEHAILTTAGCYKPAGPAASSALEGSRGALVLDESGLVLTFLPDRSGSSQTLTISAAKADHLQDPAGNRYTLRTDTTVYHGETVSTYAEYFKSIPTGTAATIYYTAAGSADYLFLSTAASREAAIITADGSAAALSALTDRTDYVLHKNGAPADISSLRRYDVATYDAAGRIMHISDLRLTGCYEDVYPNLEAPSQITVLGATFSVLPGAAADLSRFQIGDTVTLLLTQDNQVAGALSPTVGAQSNACGIVTQVSADFATVSLFSGLTVSGNPGLSTDRVDDYIGLLVKVSSQRKGQISLVPLTTSSSGALDMAAGTVGTTQLAQNVHLFEKVGRSELTRIAAGDLPPGIIPASKVSYIGKDYAGQADIVILNDVTGDRYTYGLINRTLETSGEGDWEVRSHFLSVEYDNGKATAALLGGSSLDTGDFGGLVASADGKALAGSTALTVLTGIPFQSWNRENTVTVHGIAYPVSSEVRCYNATTQKWISLAAARAFSEKADLYYDRDPMDGGKIRILVVSQ